MVIKKKLIHLIKIELIKFNSSKEIKINDKNKINSENSKSKSAKKSKEKNKSKSSVNFPKVDKKDNENLFKNK